MRPWSDIQSRISMLVVGHFSPILMTLSYGFLMLACGYQINTQMSHQPDALQSTRLTIQNLTPYTEVPLIIQRSWIRHVAHISQRSGALSRCSYPVISIALSKRSLTWGSSHLMPSKRGAQARMLSIQLACEDAIKRVDQTLFMLSLDGRYADLDSLTLIVDQSISRLISELD